MTDAHLKADELKQIYDVFGHFYMLELGRGTLLKCRSVLEIKVKGIDAKEQADAVFIMMNPGSSRPLEGKEPLRVAGVAVTGVPALVATIPDLTQYQVMRVMRHRGWRYARVLNLSDIRNPKSVAFAKEFAEAEQYPNGENHSIFSLGRRLELKQYLKRKAGAAVIRAWGVSDSLTPLVERAGSVLGAEAGLAGLGKQGCQGKFFHPLPSLQRGKEEWVSRMVGHLNELGAV